MIEFTEELAANSSPDVRRAPQCSCGRFAKFLNVRRVYNGNYEIEVLTVSCSKCGTVDIDLI